MSTLADFSSVDLVVPELRSRDDAAVVAELSAALQREERIPDARTVCSAVNRRESLGNTSCAPGWALPHARITGLPTLSLAVGRAAEPLNWFGSTQPVRLIFLSVVPDSAAAMYLAVVSGLARLSRDPVRAELLLRAPDRESLLSILAQVELRAPRSAARALVGAH